MKAAVRHQLDPTIRSNDTCDFHASLGSPPGYLGHRETHPLITQEALAASHTDKLKLSFLLFDEIEKASDALWQLLLGMLDKATLTLGDNRRVDLSQTVIFLTSNLGGGEITELMQGGMGFIQPTDKPSAGIDEKVQRSAYSRLSFLRCSSAFWKPPKVNSFSALPIPAVTSCFRKGPISATARGT